MASSRQISWPTTEHPVRTAKLRSKPRPSTPCPLANPQVARLTDQLTAGHRLLTAALPQPLTVPCHRAVNYVPPVFGLADGMPLAGINHELNRHSKRLEGVPPFEGLRRGALAIIVADQY